MEQDSPKERKDRESAVESAKYPVGSTLLPAASQHQPTLGSPLAQPGVPHPATSCCPVLPAASCELHVKAAAACFCVLPVPPPVPGTVLLCVWQRDTDFREHFLDIRRKADANGFVY